MSVVMAAEALLAQKAKKGSPFICAYVDYGSCGIPGIPHKDSILNESHFDTVIYRR
jgi:hypothetical protein